MKFQKIIIINSIFLLLIVGICNYDADATIGAYFLISEDISANLDVPEGLIFSPDGTKMYVVDNTGDLIEEYALSNAWQVSTATHAGSNYPIVDAQTDVPEDIAFNSDGTKMYLVDRDSDKILEYNLGTAYDVSTASYQSGQDGNVSAKTGNPEDIAFNSDGTKMYILENDGSDTVLEYALGTAYDVSDETYNDAFTLTVQNNGVDAFEFSSDGTRMYVADNSGISQFTMGTAWDVSTSVYKNIFDTTDKMENPKGLAFSATGKDMYITGTSDKVHHYKLSFKWDLFKAEQNDALVFSPHIHDKVVVSINSNEKFVLNMKDTDVTNISANVGDKIDVTISVGDDKNIERISPIKLITNFAKKPQDMNNYFKTNFDDYGQVGLSVYEVYQNKNDIKYDFNQTFTWNEPTIKKQKFAGLVHDDVGYLPIKEQELLITYSMESNKTMSQSQVTVKISDDDYMRNQITLPFTLEILPNIDGNSIEKTIPKPELKNNGKLEFFIKTDKSEYSHGNKIIITGQIPNDDFNPTNAKNIKFSITSPENNVIIAGEFAPNLDGSFTYDTFAMDKIWKTDGDYVFNINFNSFVSDVIIQYDNTEFENSQAEPITSPVAEPITSPVAEPTYTEPIIPECGVGTEDVNGICQVIQTKDESKGGGCLIATATYGSEMAPQVQQLRELRDNQLSQTSSGSAFMSTFNNIYYSFSPTIADMEREHPMFKEVVKLAITPMISSLSLMENANSESEVLGIGISVIVLNLGMYLGVPAMVVIGIRKRF